MKKMGPILATISGLFTLVIATLSILVLKDVITGVKFLGHFDTDVAKVASDSKTGLMTIYIIMIVFALIQISLGSYALQKPRGIAAFILLGIFAATIVMQVIGGVHASSWPATSIITIVINSIAAAGLLVGLLHKK